MANILLIDDDAFMRTTGCYALSRKGHWVFVAGSGRAAVIEFNKKRPDVIITDLTLPGREEIEALLGSSPEIPVIVISGDLSRCGDSTCLAGAVKLEKPFSLLQLMSAVTQVLASRATV